MKHPVVVAKVGYTAAFEGHPADAKKIKLIKVSNATQSESPNPRLGFKSAFTI